MADRWIELRYSDDETPNTHMRNIYRAIDNELNVLDPPEIDALITKIANHYLTKEYIQKRST